MSSSAPTTRRRRRKRRHDRTDCEFPARPKRYAIDTGAGARTSNRDIPFGTTDFKSVASTCSATPAFSTSTTFQPASEPFQTLPRPRVSLLDLRICLSVRAVRAGAHSVEACVETSESADSRIVRPGKLSKSHSARKWAKLRMNALASGPAGGVEIDILNKHFGFDRDARGGRNQCQPSFVGSFWAALRAWASPLSLLQRTPAPRRLPARRTRRHPKLRRMISALWTPW